MNSFESGVYSKPNFMNSAHNSLGNVCQSFSKSPSQRRATAQNLDDFDKVLRFVRANWKNRNFLNFSNKKFSIFTYFVCQSTIFGPFLRKISNSKTVMAQKKVYFYNV